MSKAVARVVLPMGGWWRVQRWGIRWILTLGVLYMV